MTSQLIPKMLTTIPKSYLDSNTLSKILTLVSVTNSKQEQSVYNPPRSRKLSILND